MKKEKIKLLLLVSLMFGVASPIRSQVNYNKSQRSNHSVNKYTPETTSSTKPNRSSSVSPTSSGKVYEREWVVVLTQRHVLWGIKTNMLYDLALMPNIESEFYWAQQWSVNAEVQVAWWKLKHNDHFYQIAAGGPEIRYWLQPNGHYTGHYIGLYSSIGLYDLKWKDIGYQSNQLWSAGLSWGYVKPISNKLSLEFGLAVGYAHTVYDEYEVNQSLDNHYDYIRTRSTSFFGPTKIKVGLVWRNFNMGKKR